MKFLSKVILVLESNLLRIYVEAGVDLGCAAPSICLCVCSTCVCLGFVCVKKCLWLCFGICDCVMCMCLCVSMSQMSPEHLFWGLCQFLFLCKLLRVCVCVFNMRLCIYICVCVCVLWISSCTCCLCVASVLPLVLFLLQSAAATNCSYKLQLQQAKEWKNVVKM